MIYDEVVSKVANSIGLDRKLVEKIYMAYWRAVREYITALPLKEELTEVDFLNSKPNVNIPSLGKFYITLDRYKRLKNIIKQ